MNFHVLTLFPEMVENGLGTSILGKAAKKGHISLDAVDIRDYTLDKHKKVDDYPYGGGAGMLMQAQPVFDAYRSVVERIWERRGREAPVRVIYVTPQGKVFHQGLARELAREEDLVFLCGHYEGIDERVLEEIVTDYISIGDYVLTGGELPAMVMIDAISRLVPGVLKNEESAEFESFHDDLLEYPQYTRPEVWQGKQVPPVLLCGDHAKVDKWRLARSEERTRMNRPDLYEKYAKKGRALAYLMKDKLSHMDMLEVIRRQQGEICFADENGGVLLRDRPSGAWMISAVDVDMGEQMLSLIPRQDRMCERTEGKDAEQFLLLVHQSFLRDSFERRSGRTGKAQEYLQAVYTRKLPVEEAEGYDIRPLDEGALEFVCEHYLGVPSREYLKGRLSSGEMFGAWADGSLAGFIGMHAEGSMGLLEVLAQHRRKGIGEALERHLINFILQRGQVPFCLISPENEASAALQRKIGLKIAKGRIYWFS